MFGERSAIELKWADKFERRCAFSGCAAIVLGCCLQMWRYLVVYRSLEDVFLAACSMSAAVSVLSYFPAYPIWTTVLKRRRGALVATASFISLSCTVMELTFSVTLPFDRESRTRVEIWQMEAERLMLY